MKVSEAVVVSKKYLGSIMKKLVVLVLGESLCLKLGIIKDEYISDGNLIHYSFTPGIDDASVPK